MSWVSKIAGIAIAFMGLSAVEASTTFDLTSSVTPNGDGSLTYNSGSLSLTITGFYGADVDNLVAFNDALSQTNKGLRYNRPGGADFKGIDGRDVPEILRLEFSENVAIENILFSYAENDDQFDFFVDTDNTGFVFIGNLDPTGNNNMSNPYDFNPQSQASSVFGLGAGYTQSSDDYSIRSITVGAVPEPSTWLMMLAGFALTGFALKRRKGVAAAA